MASRILESLDCPNKGGNELRWSRPQLPRLGAKQDTVQAQGTPLTGEQEHANAIHPREKADSKQATNPPFCLLESAPKLRCNFLVCVCVWRRTRTNNTNNRMMMKKARFQ